MFSLIINFQNIQNLAKKLSVERNEIGVDIGKATKTGVGCCIHSYKSFLAWLEVGSKGNFTFLCHIASRIWTLTWCYSYILWYFYLFFAKIYQIKWKHLWYNAYCHKKCMQLPDFKSWMKLFIFHIVLIPLGKVWI